MNCADAKMINGSHLRTRRLYGIRGLPTSSQNWEIHRFTNL
jgi:hypothetical protein